MHGRSMNYLESLFHLPVSQNSPISHRGRKIAILLEILHSDSTNPYAHHMRGAQPLLCYPFL